MVAQRMRLLVLEAKKEFYGPLYIQKRRTARRVILGLE